MRPRKRIHTVPASPVTSDATAVPAIESTSTGLRPMRSDTRPQIGENTNWAAENAVISAVAVTADAPKCLAYNGRIGSTIPNPTKSSATLSQRVPKPGGNLDVVSRPAASLSSGTTADGSAVRPVFHNPAGRLQLPTDGVRPRPIPGGPGRIPLAHQDPGL